MAGPWHRVRLRLPPPVGTAVEDVVDGGASRLVVRAAAPYTPSLMEPLDFELGIASIAGGDYEVSVLRSPAGEAHATMRFPFDGLELQTRLQALEIALLRSGGTRRQLDSTDGQKVRDFGRDLFDALIQGDVRSRFDASLAEAERADRPLRVRLRFDAPALAALPWEFLYDQRQPDYMVLSANTPLVRYIEVPETVKPLTVTRPAADPRHGREPDRTDAAGRRA